MSSQVDEREWKRMQAANECEREGWGSPGYRSTLLVGFDQVRADAARFYGHID